MIDARFTQKAKENIYTLHDYEIVSEVPGDEDDMLHYAINKLGRIEDKEEALEFDPFLLLNILNYGIWAYAHSEVKNEDGDIEDRYDKFYFLPRDLELYISAHAINVYWQCSDEIYATYYFKDYGKTWSLNKEDLQ